MKKAELSPPDAAEREYTRLLHWYVRQIAASTRRIVMPALGGIVAQGRRELTADSASEDIVILLAQLLESTLQWRGMVERKLPDMFTLLAKNNDRALILAVKGATGVTLPPAGQRGGSLLGVNAYKGEQWLADMQRAWVSQNVSLVKSIESEFHDRLETIVRQGVLNGSSVKQLSESIQNQFGVTKNRATLIAQDQILSANARITQIRAESLGIERYEWATVGDSRVRPEHAELNGKVFSWDKPPIVGHPGTPIRCRCRARLLLPDD